MLLPRRLFHLRSRFTLLFHCGSFSPLCCDPALSVFASKCQSVECHAVKAARCDLGDPDWGIPGFRIEPLLLRTPFNWPM